MQRNHENISTISDEGKAETQRATLARLGYVEGMDWFGETFEVVWRKEIAGDVEEWEGQNVWSLPEFQD